MSDDNTPSIIILYHTRLEAEAAMGKGKNFGDRRLTLTWYSDPLPPPSPSPAAEVRKERLLSTASDDGALSLTSQQENELLVEEDLDEEEKDERSWRR